MFYLGLTISFLAGGIPFGLLAGYLSGHGDIRQQGSKNIGATNVWRIAGPKPAILATLGDVGKGIGAVYLSMYLYDPSWGWGMSQPTAGLLFGIAAVLGHSFSPFLKFKGGKGVNTTLGVFIILLPLETLIAIGAFSIVVVITRFISLGSIVGVSLFTLILFVEKFAFSREIETGFLIASSLLTCLILLTHRHNIRRLIDGSENKFQSKQAVK